MHICNVLLDRVAFVTLRYMFENRSRLHFASKRKNTLQFREGNDRLIPYLQAKHIYQGYVGIRNRQICNTVCSAG